MGLISDRKNKAKREKENAALLNGKGFLNHHPPNNNNLGGSRGIFGSQILSKNVSSGKNLPKYPAGYYTTPVHSSSSGWGSGGGHHHPAQPKYHPNVNPRYQTWVAPRKQPALNQLVRRLRAETRKDFHRVWNLDRFHLGTI